MNQLALDILAKLDELSNPYVDIRELSPDFDINSENFVAAFRSLELENLIASANTNGCGLSVSADGIPCWSVVDLYVTPQGKAALNPPKKSKASIFLKILEHPVISGLLVAGVGGVITYIFKST